MDCDNDVDDDDGDDDDDDDVVVVGFVMLFSAARVEMR